MSPLPRKLQAVVLDWAGTIIDHGSRAPVQAFCEIFRRSGVEITTDEARTPMGMEKRDHIVALLKMPRIMQAWRETHGCDAGDSDIDELYHQFLPVQAELLPRHIDLIPGVLETLEDCRRRGLKIGSSSGYAAPLMKQLVGLAEQQGLRVDAVVSATEVAGGRPAPWMIFENMERLGVYPPTAVVVVDDTAVGVRAGLNAGAWSIGVIETGNEFGVSVEELLQLSPAERDMRRNAGRQSLIAAGAHYAIDTVADLPKTLDTITERLAQGDNP